MSDESLIQAMPDVVAFVRPDGLVTHHLGGRRVPFVHGSGSLAGRRLEESLHAHVAALVARLVRKAIAGRTSCEAEFSVDGATYQTRVSAQGPKRALCVIRHVADAPVVDQTALDPAAGGSAERRGFVRRFKQSVSDAALCERRLALCMIYLDGLTDISRLIDFSIGDRLLTEALRQLPPGNGAPAEASWYVGQLGEGVLGAVIEGGGASDREVAEALCAALARPIRIDDATFHLKPSAGVAVLGQDATEPRALLEHARAAMLESRRAGGTTVQFYSDTLRMLPVARLDVERELREAISDGQIGLRYVARHDLATGRVLAVQAYMRWVHPLRGEVPPGQFLPIADATGQAVSLSRSALHQLVTDAGTLCARFGPDVAVSFGALRQHLSSGQLLRDCRQLLPANASSRWRLELRIAERTLATLNRPERALDELIEFGATVVVDEFGRGVNSVARLAQMPLRALQIDRALVVEAGRSASALRACRAVVALARALDLAPIAAGVDDEATRMRLLEVGCVEGLGDHYPAVAEVVPHVVPSLAAG